MYDNISFFCTFAEYLYKTKFKKWDNYKKGIRIIVSHRNIWKQEFTPISVPSPASKDLK